MFYSKFMNSSLSSSYTVFSNLIRPCEDKRTNSDDPEAKNNRLTEPILLDTPLNKRIPSEKRKIKGMRTTKISAIRQSYLGIRPNQQAERAKVNCQDPKAQTPNKKGKDA